MSNNKILPYLDESGRYDIRKSEQRRMAMKSLHPQKNFCKFDLLRFAKQEENKAINNLINTIFNKNK